MIPLNTKGKKVLHLTLKKKWFDMIASGVKREEYREIKPYWNKRFQKKYDVIKFRNGYQKDAPTMLVELKGIQRSLGIIEWGAPAGIPVYILRLGDIHILRGEIMKEIKICSQHHEVPLISTMAFNGAEYWCPACGETYGTFGHYDTTEETEELIKTKEKYAVISQDYLGAKSTKVCQSLMHEGKRITPDKLPDDIKKRNQEIIDNWQYEIAR